MVSPVAVRYLGEEPIGGGGMLGDLKCNSCCGSGPGMEVWRTGLGGEAGPEI